LNTLAITCLRDEGPWLLDWLSHHKAAGFTHFLIASHDCTDGSDQMLDALDAAGLITHVPFVPKGEKSVQWQAMKLLSKHKRYQNADLALFFDVDEYLVMQDAGAVAELMPETADAMPLRWHLFGNSGFGTWDDVPVPERFTMAAPDGISLPLAHFFKTLHRPKAFRDLGVHRPKNRKDAALPNWVSASGAALPASFSAAQARINLFGVAHEKERAWLNHYSVRSIEEFVLKSARGTGLGAALINEAIAIARARPGVTEAKLGAQIQALGFYEKLGFTAVGPVYDDAGIDHRDMVLDLT